MTNHKAAFRSIIISAAFVTMAAWATPSFAYSDAQRVACTPDAFRLCSSEIPNIDGITACMRKQKSSLSIACRAVFDR